MKEEREKEEKGDERYKNYKDILFDNWISPRMLWRGRVLVFTRHIIGEIEKLNKDYEYVLELLEKESTGLFQKSKINMRFFTHTKKSACTWCTQSTRKSY